MYVGWYVFSIFSKLGLTKHRLESVYTVCSEIGHINFNEVPPDRQIIEQASWVIDNVIYMFGDVRQTHKRFNVIKELTSPRNVFTISVPLSSAKPSSKHSNNVRGFAGDADKPFDTSNS